jgi:hypothetical protein
MILVILKFKKNKKYFKIKIKTFKIVSNISLLKNKKKFYRFRKIIFKIK